MGKAAGPLGPGRGGGSGAAGDFVAGGRAGAAGPGTLSDFLDGLSVWHFLGGSLWRSFVGDFAFGFPPVRLALSLLGARWFCLAPVSGPVF